MVEFNRPISERIEEALLQIETEFITDLDRRSVDWWVNNLKIVISLDYVRKYSEENKWVERRKAFWGGVQAQWLRERGQELILMRKEELREVSNLRAEILQFCTPAVSETGELIWPIKPTSLEGMIKVFIQLDGVVETKRDAIADSLSPLLSLIEREKENNNEQSSNIPFNQDEMRILAHNLLRRRQLQHRSKFGIEDNDNDEDTEFETKCDENEEENIEKII